jgi:16S rRNA G966 N2-methylase RsmD
MEQVARNKKRQITILDKALDIISNKPKIILPDDGDFYNMIPDAMPKGCQDRLWWSNDYEDEEEAFFPFNPTEILRPFKLREEWTEKGMWAFVSWRWVNPLAAWIGNRKCLEVMSGCGWLSLALMSRGVDIKATDDMSWHGHEIRKGKWKQVVETEKLDAIDAVKKYAKEVDLIVMSWPPYDENIGYKVLREMNRQNKNARMIYIGEGWGGCTADDEFFQHFEEIEDEGFNEAANKFQAWEGIHDRLILGKYVKKVGEENIL